MVQSQLSLAPDSSVLLADEGFEGSGSGDRPYWPRRPGQGPDDQEDEDESDPDEYGSSGSGMGPIVDGKSSAILFAIDLLSATIGACLLGCFQPIIIRVKTSGNKSKAFAKPNFRRNELSF